MNVFFAEIAQLVEHNLAKVGVASSSLVFRSEQGRNTNSVCDWKCPRGGMVDALVSGASVERRASSSLVVGTYSPILFAEIAQLVEHNLAKVGVASSSLVFRSKKR